MVGGGGREHALVWKIAQSPRVTDIFIAPGNAGTAAIGHNLPIKSGDIPSLAAAAREHRIDLVVVGPEAPLAAGIVDHLEAASIPVFGPTRAATQIESSKVFSKRLMEKYGIPCARGITFDSHAGALRYVDAGQPPFVVKADGLAAGKGVVIARTRDEAKKALSDAMVDRVFGPAGEQVIIEECLTGREVSFLAFTDGKSVAPMVAACDYKRVKDNDEGPNTGGMGSYSPPGFFTYELARQAMETVLAPAIKGMAAEGTPYKGVLYAGLMLTADGIRTLEFNARFGDPETQAILPRLKSDIVDVFLAVVENRLSQVKLQWSGDPCVGVVMASEGYPGSYKTGFPIDGLDKVEPDCAVFHAGTRAGEDGKTLTDGGRVLTVAAMGKTMAKAREKAYANVARIRFPGCHYRRDIAQREVA